MSGDRNSISVCIEVSNINQAVDIYVNKWKLFELISKGGLGADEFANLQFIDSATRFRLGLYQAGQKDSHGRPLPSAKSARISIPKSDFWSWVDLVLGSREAVESTPWSADVILRDPFGHIFVIYTTEADPGEK